MEILIALVTLIFSVLSVVLFFKVWEMTNVVKDIKNILVDVATHTAAEANSNVNETNATSEFQLNQLVIVKADESQFRINDIIELDGVTQVYSEKYNKYFKVSEIEDFDKYWESKRK